MSRVRSISWFGLVLLTPVILAQSCESEIEEGPPSLTLGRDECAECGMSIVDQKAAAAMRVVADDESRCLVFDDIGCLLDYEAEHSDSRLIGSWVQDRAGGGWVATDEAWFIVSQDLRTPMASGIGSWRSAEAAAAEGKRFGTAMVTLREVRLYANRIRNELEGLPAGAPNGATANSKEVNTVANSKEVNTVGSSPGGN